MTIEQRINFIESIELPEMPAVDERAGLFKNDSEADGAYVNDGNVTGMLMGINNQQREDLLDSQLFAQLAANKKYDRFNDPDSWYKSYREVLENIAWTVESFHFQQYRSRESTFTISEVVVSTLLNVVAKASPILKLANRVIESLGEEKNNKALLRFTQNSMSSESGNFQALGCYIDPELKTLSAAFSGSHFKVSRSRKSSACSEFESNEVTMFASAQIIRLNEVTYAKIRKPIAKKLGKKVTEYVSEIEI